MPPSTSVEAAVFVLGGVGVTPALSLLPQFARSCGDRLHVCWSARSSQLLRRCAPLLEAQLPPWGRRNIRLSHTGSEQGAIYLPTSTKEGREDLEAYLSAVANDLALQGVSKAALFICGPAPLRRAALLAAASPGAAAVAAVVVVATTMGKTRARGAVTPADISPA